MGLDYQRRKSFIGVLFVLALVLFQFTSTKPSFTYNGFQKLQWSVQNRCGAEHVPPQWKSSGEVVGTYYLTKTKYRARCTSEPFIATSEYLEIEYYHQHRPGTAGKIQLGIQRPNEAKPLVIELSAEDPEISELWRTNRFRLPKELRGVPITASLIDTVPNTEWGWGVVRSRINQYDLSPLQRVRLSLSSLPGQILSSVLLGILLTMFVIGVESWKPTLTFLGVGLAIAIGVHFRTSIFFMWDEWHVIERFQQYGLKTLFIPHNEHLIPVAFGLYYLELLLFGARYHLYQIVTIACHVINTALVFYLVGKVADTYNEKRRVSGIAATVFLVSGLSGEVLQWPFEMCLVLMTTFVLVAMIASEKMNNGWRLDSGTVLLVAALLAPLTFGNGFIICALVPLFALYLTVDREGGALRRNGIMSVLTSGGIVASALSVAVALYLYFYLEGSRMVFPPTTIWERIIGTSSYLLVGGELGVSLRGMGLFPSYELLAPSKAWELARLPGDGEIWLAIIGLSISAASVWFASRARPESSKRYWRVWGLGQLFILACFGLPALGRWQLGIFQALSLRYSYLPLIGLIFTLLPIISVLSCEREQLRFSCARPIAVWALFAIFSTNLFGVSYFSYFTKHGLNHRDFVAQLVDWNQRIKATGAPYEGTGTELAGLYPLLRPTITPGRHPDQIYGVLNYLDGRRYPLR